MNIRPPSGIRTHIIRFIIRRSTTELWDHPQRRWSLKGDSLLAAWWTWRELHPHCLAPRARASCYWATRAINGGTRRTCTPHPKVPTAFKAAPARLSGSCSKMVDPPGNAPGLSRLRGGCNHLICLGSMSLNSFLYCLWTHTEYFPCLYITSFTN